MTGEFNTTDLQDDAIVLGPDMIPGKFGGCTIPSDVDSSIVYSQGNIGTRNAGTVEFWMKFDEMPANNTRVFEGIEYWSGQRLINMYLHINVTDNVMRFGYDTHLGGNTWVWHNLIAPIPSVGDWHHIALEWGGAGQMFFIDGVLEASNDWTGSNYLMEAICLGSIKTNGGGPADVAMAYIDDFRLSTRQMYSTDFTPPTSALTSTTGTVFIDHLDGNTIGVNNGFLLGEPTLYGEYISAVFDAHAPLVELGQVDWSSMLPEGAGVDVFIRWSEDPGMNVSSNWTKVDKGPVNLLASRYLQYLVGLSRTGAEGPEFRSFRLSYAGTVEVMVSLDGSRWTTANGTSRWSVELDVAEGIIPIYVASYDIGRNITISMVTVVIDLSPPTGYMVVGNGAQYTNNREVPVRLEVWDNTSVTHMKISDAADLAGAPWMSFKPAFTYDLGDMNGNRTLYVVVRDIAGHESAVMSDSIVLDTIKPIGTLLVDDGSGIALSQLVDVAIEAYDDNGVTYMRAGDISDIESRAWAPYRGTSKLDLGSREGFHTVCVDVRDVAGNVLRLLAEVTLDLHAPTVEIVIEDGKDIVAYGLVSVRVSALDANGVTGMRRADSQEGLLAAGWGELEASYKVDLGDGDHSHTEWLEVRDAAGRTAVASDSIVVDQTPPTGSIAIEGGAPFIHWSLVNLTLELGDATSGVDRFRLANTPSFTGSQWMEPRPAMRWELQRGEDNRTVYMEVRDTAGLVTSSEATVLVVTTPPKGFAWATRRVYGSVDITLGLEWDRATSMWVSESSTADGPWLPVNASPVIKIAAGDGTRTVYVRIEDQYGLRSDVMGVSFILDTTSPDVTFTSPTAGDVIKTQKLTISGVADDDNGLVRIEVRVDDGAWLPMPNQTLWTNVVDLGRWGEHTVTVRAEDVVGNRGEATLSVKAEEPLEVTTPASSLLLALVLLICITAVIVAWMLVRGRRPPEGPGPGGR